MRACWRCWFAAWTVAVCVGVAAAPASASSASLEGLPPTLAPTVQSGASAGADSVFTPAVSSPAIRPVSAGTVLSVGTRPSGIAATNAKAYVANASDNTVSVVSLGASPGVVDTIAVGRLPNGVALSPDESHLYVTNFRDGTLSIIDTSTDTVSHTVTVGSDPTGVVQADTSVYVANLLSGTVSVVDPSSGTVTRTITLTGSQTPAPSGLAASGDGSKLYVDDVQNGTMDVIDLSSSPATQVSSTTVGTWPAYLSVAGTTAYVANATKGGSTPGTVSELDLTGSPPTVTHTVAVGSHPYGIAALPALGEVFATNSADDDVSVIDTTTHAELSTVPLGQTPNAIVVTPDGGTAIASNESDDSISILHVNQPPAISAPTTSQSVLANGASNVHNQLTFSGANSNLISTSDPDAGSNPIRVSLSVAHGTLSLSGITGLSFSSGGSGSASMTFTGTQSDVDTALAGMTYEPDLSYSGSDTLSMLVEDQGNSGDIGKPESAGATIDISVDNTAPTVGAVSFSGAIGNTTFGVGTTPSQPSAHTTGTVLSNSSDANGDSLSAVAGSITTAQGGSATMNADGTFTYNPPAGFQGDDTFTFTISDGTATSTGTATVTVSNMVWYVNKSAASGGDGTSIAPFQDFGGSNGASGDGDTIFVYSGTYSTGAVLQASQELIGQPDGLTVNAQTIVSAGGTNPIISVASPGSDIALANGTVVKGVNEQGSGTGFSASSVNSFSVFTDVADTAATGVSISGGSGVVNFSGSVNSTGTAVAVTGRTGGTVAFNGAVASTGGGGISLTNNTGAAVNFTGLVTSSTSSSKAFTATGGGTIEVTNTASTLASTGNTALDIETDAIGSSGVTFATVNAGQSTGPVKNGILITGTGTTGGTVTVNGGTIYNSSGSSNTFDFAAVELGTNIEDSTTEAPVGTIAINNMTLQAKPGTGVQGSYGVKATNVAKLTLSGNTVKDNPTDGIFVSGFGSPAGDGQFNITGNTLTGQGGSAIAVTYPEGGDTANSTTSNSGFIQDNTVGTSGTANSGSTGGEGIDAIEQGSGALTVSVMHNTINQIKQSYGIDSFTNGGPLNLTLTRNNVQQTGQSSLDGITVDAGSNNPTVCVDANSGGTVANQNTSQASSTNFGGLGFDAVGMSVVENGSATFKIAGYSGPSNDSGGEVESLLNSDNTFSGPNAGDGSIAFNNSGAPDFVGGSCTTPSPFAKLGNPGGQSRAPIQTTQTTRTTQASHPAALSTTSQHKKHRHHKRAKRRHRHHKSSIRQARGRARAMQKILNRLRER